VTSLEEPANAGGQLEPEIADPVQAPEGLEEPEEPQAEDWFGPPKKKGKKGKKRTSILATPVSELAEAESLPLPASPLEEPATATLEHPSGPTPSRATVVTDATTGKGEEALMPTTNLEHPPSPGARASSLPENSLGDADNFDLVPQTVALPPSPPAEPSSQFFF